MKKVLIVLLLVSVATIVLADDISVTFSQTFLSRLTNCMPYKETRNVGFLGENLSIIQQIKGWENGKCGYVTYPNNDKSETTICNFTKAQISEIIAASKKTGTSTYSGNGITYTSDNLVDIVMTKFLNDGITCKFPDRYDQYLDTKTQTIWINE